MLGPVVINSDWQVYVLLSGFAGKYLVSIWAAIYFSPEFSYWQSYRDIGYLFLYFYHLSSLSSPVIELACLYKQENKPDM